MTDEILVGSFVLYAIVFAVMLLIARAIFSINTLLRNQRITNHLLTGIAARLKVDPTYFDRTKV